MTLALQMSKPYNMEKALASVMHCEEGSPGCPPESSCFCCLRLLGGSAGLQPGTLQEKRKGGRPALSTHLLEAVNHEEDVGVAHLGFLPFAVHGVFAGGGKHLLKEDKWGRAEKPAWWKPGAAADTGEGPMLLHQSKARDVLYRSLGGSWVHV